MNVTPTNAEHVAWSRLLFDSLAEGGVWGIPRSGLLFRREGDELVLFDRMPHMAGMPITPEALSEQQASECKTICEYFRAAGIPVRVDL